MALAGVYKLTDPATGVYYIGSSGNLKSRLSQHLSDVKKGRHHSVRLQLHHNSNIDVKWKLETLLLTDDREAAYRHEEELIKASIDDPLMLNVNIKAKGAALRKGSVEEIRRVAKLVETLVAKYEAMTAEERKVIYGSPGERNGMCGRQHTDEVKRRISELNKGNSYAKGVKRSAAQRAFLSELAKSRTGEKNPFYGKKHSEETKRHISRVKKANSMLPANARKISIDDTVYESLMAARRATGVSQALLIYRIKSNKPKYSGYCYV